MLAERSYQYRPEQPFTLSSGATSPFYLDARVITWDPEAKPLIGALVFELVTGKADATGGLTLGADPIAGAVAYYSQIAGAPIRAFTVRKQAKEHGMGRAIEGSIRPGDRVAIVDDVVTTGTSTLDAIDRCREAGYPITAVVILVDREEGGLERIRAAVPGVACTALFTRSELHRRVAAAMNRSRAGHRRRASREQARPRRPRRSAASARAGRRARSARVRASRRVGWRAVCWSRRWRSGSTPTVSAASSSTTTATPSCATPGCTTATPSRSSPTRRGGRRDAGGGGGR